MLRSLFEKMGCHLPPPPESVWEMMLEDLLSLIPMAMVMVYLYIWIKRKSKDESDTKSQK